MALILDDEYNLEIIVISNDGDIENVKEDLKKKYPYKYKNCFQIMNTNKRLKQNIHDSEVREAFSKIL